MRVLIGCEYSGIVRESFINQGFDAWSCDFLDTEIKGNHYKCDVLDIINDNWDLAIFHPPCTRLTNSGVRWLHERNLWDDMRESAEFFKKLLYADIPYIAVENPVMHKYAAEIIGKKYDQTIQPYQFGHDASKRTCLWLNNLPKLIPTNIIIKDRYSNQTPSGQNNLPPSKDRWKLRSKTFEGIAEAMAIQWGNYIKKQERK